MIRGNALERQDAVCARPLRLRVIYADLSEFVGTTEEWEQVRDGILIIQVEEQPGHWVSLYGHDWYYVSGGRAYCYTGPHAPDELHVGPSQHERSGRLVTADVWQRAKAKMHQWPSEDARLSVPRSNTLPSARCSFI